MNFSDHTNILSGISFFECWDEQSRRALAEFCSLDHFPAGSAVFRKGEGNGAFFIVNDGEVVITRPTETGQEREAARYIAGDSFGELDMLTRNVRNADAWAVLPSELLRIPGRGRSLEDLLRTYPAAAARLFDSCLRVMAGRIRRADAVIAENPLWAKQMRNQLYQDMLTGLFNAVFLREQLPSLLKDGPVSLMMIKPDNLKTMNDQYGREAGDEAMILLAGTLKRLAAETAMVCRFQGSAFAGVFPGVDKDAGYSMAEHIKDMVNNLDLSTITSSAAFHLSVRIGSAAYPQDAGDAGELIALAHKMLSIDRNQGKV
ncbi:MAG: GGDEF domain-containing protein [Treponema sp.]|jgi:diguanylate cyclase (GGDEF)-like protein|nr:GGDEF domain-containing protein [Treponema sp.]